MSGGRVQFGIGAGWNRQEMENHGTDYKRRFLKMGDQVEAVKKIWAEDEASYDGDFVKFDPIWCWPKPVQAPNPPVWPGGESIHTLRRVVDHCDGCLPRAADANAIFTGMKTLSALADKAGRDRIPVTVFGPHPKSISQYRDAGVDRSVMWLQAGNEDDTLRRMDRYTEHLTPGG